MELTLDPHIQAQLDRLSLRTGRPGPSLVEDAVVGYLLEVEQTSEMIDRRLDELQTGKVTLVSPETVAARFAARSQARRNSDS